MWFGLNGSMFVFSQLDDLHQYNIVVIQDWAEDSFANCSASHYFHMKDLWRKGECHKGGRMLIA